MSAIQHLSHLGLCVTDVERSRRFYCAALGFRERGILEAGGPETARLLELPGARLRAVFVERDGLRLELLQFLEPAPASGATDAPRAMNAPGLTHLSLRVADLDAACAAIAAAGGRVLERSRTEIPAAKTRVVFATDPDGTRLELIESPADPVP